MSTVKILFIHGIGFQEEDLRWQNQWRDAALLGLQATNPDAEVEAAYLEYDQLFKDNDASNLEMVKTSTEMLSSWLVGKVGGLFDRSRGIFDQPVHAWEARPGMVAEWAGDDALREKLRRKLEDKVTEFEPDVIAAHSLGSLLSYEWLRMKTDNALVKNTTYLTFGSQISNPALSPIFRGQILMPAVRQWINLWNRQDKVFVDSIRLNEQGFEQIPLNREYGHDGTGYLSDITTRTTAWNQIALVHAPATRTVTGGARALKARLRKDDHLIQRRLKARESRERKALLIGINEYANPANNLEGCVNDVFEVSAVLQECGFKADDIRIVLNDRATATGIKDRMEWLLDGARGEDVRFLFYSGHGAQMPSYGGDDVPEDMDECLVPYDFGWSPETAVVDDWFFELYRNLPYTVQFVGMLDCCHSGGLAREGGARVRGLTPPDDIRHRALEWNPQLQMWVPRGQFAEKTADGEKSLQTEKTGLRTTRALGSGAIGRSEHKQLRRTSRGIDASKPYGPFQPVLMKACTKDELAMEYRHGNQSFGAFTYSLVHVLRNQMRQGMTFEQIMRETAKRLKTLGYTQNPDVEGPSARVTQKVPWHPPRNTAAVATRPKSKPKSKPKAKKK